MNKKFEFILMTLNDYQRTPHSFLDCYFRDGWIVVEINKELKSVLFAREVFGWDNGSRNEKFANN